MSLQRDPRVLHDTTIEADAMRFPSGEALILPAGDVSLYAVLKDDIRREGKLISAK
jgi:hypothetical protein